MPTSRVLLGLLFVLSACQSTAFEGEAPSLRFSSIEVSGPPADDFFWNERQDAVFGPKDCDAPQIGQGTLSESDLAGLKEECITRNSELAKETVGLRAEYIKILEKDLQNVFAPRFQGTTDAKLLVDLKVMRTVSAANAIIAGEPKIIHGDVKVIEIASGKTLAMNEDIIATVGTGGFIGAAISSTGKDDALKLSDAFAKQTCAWLKGERGACDN